MKKESKFEQDLKKLLHTLEKLCSGRADHVDYAHAYKDFVERWRPKDEQ